MARTARTRAVLVTVIAVIALVVAAVAGLAVWKFTRSDGAQRSESTVGTPPELLVGIPTSTPQPSWVITLADLLSEPNLKQGLIPGSVGDRAFALVYPATVDPTKPAPARSWVYSYDARTGDVLFSPVELTGSVGGCYINGPDMLTCLGRQDPGVADSQPWAWVIDSHTGKLTYTGPTDIGPNADGNYVYKVGGYPVAAIFGSGWYGIGDKGQKSWFVPGTGLASDDSMWSPDVPAQRLVVGQGMNDGPYFLYRPSDGAVIADNLKARPWLYSGGYAIPSRTADDPDGTLTFYDESGKELSHSTLRRTLAAQPMTMHGEMLVVDIRDPKAPDEARWVVFDAAGKQITNVPSQGDPGKARVVIIGDKMYVSDTVGVENTEKENPWKQIDLTTGSILRTCADLNLRGYIASDGKTILSAASDDSGRVTVNATNASDCSNLWTLGDGVAISKVNTSLVEVTDTQINGVARAE
ncbi:Uncharacterised protein [Mycolicibacterium fortuitum]|uniref:Uncharacterized protein n=1 Tax=Mycolicibacterium fortuitum TaxID=1766 RepID=A0A378WD13_MYCFO|nr:Uncharacterised protein [Mycolicibacterium fortuitum]